jgi:signal peptidase
MTGSMEPRITPGDIVIARPVPATDLKLGQILLVEDPDQAGHLRLHRFVDVRADGSLTLKGDANPEADSSPIPVTDVHGVGVLRVPLIGLPVVWAAEHQILKVLGVAAGLGLLGWLATLDRAPSNLTDENSGRRNRRRKIVAVVLVVAGVGALAVPIAAFANFTRSTATTASYAAATVPSPTGVTAGCGFFGLIGMGVDWTSSGTGATAYKVQRSINSGSFTDIATVGGSTTDWADSGTSWLTKYSYRVIRIDGTWQSQPSAPSAATTGCLFG